MMDLPEKLRLSVAYLENMMTGPTTPPEWSPTDMLKAAADEIERLEEIIRETKPDTWSFDTLLYVGKRLLRDIYPADIFTGESGDSGPQYVVALRAAIARIDQEDAK